MDTRRYKYYFLSSKYYLKHFIFNTFLWYLSSNCFYWHSFSHLLKISMSIEKKYETYHKNVLKIKCLKLYFELKKSPEIFNHYFAFVYLLFKKRCSSMVFWKQYYTYLTVISCPYISNLLMALGVMGPQKLKNSTKYCFFTNFKREYFLFEKKKMQ